MTLYQPGPKIPYIADPSPDELAYLAELKQKVHLLTNAIEVAEQQQLKTQRYRIVPGTPVYRCTRGGVWDEVVTTKPVTYLGTDMLYWMSLDPESLERKYILEWIDQIEGTEYGAQLLLYFKLPLEAHPYIMLAIPDSWCLKGWRA